MSHPDFAHVGGPAINLIEECAELIQALAKLQRFGPGVPPYDNVAHVRAEIADVRRRIDEWLGVPSPADRAASVGAVSEKRIAAIMALVDEFVMASTRARECDYDTAGRYRDEVQAEIERSLRLPTPQAERSDTERLDWLESNECSNVFKIGNRWYTRNGYQTPHHRATNLRTAIDTAMRTTAAATSEGAK